MNSILLDCKNNFEEFKNNRMRETDWGVRIKAYLDRVFYQCRHYLKICILQLMLRVACPHGKMGSASFASDGAGHFCPPKGFGALTLIYKSPAADLLGLGPFRDASDLNLPSSWPQ